MLGGCLLAASPYGDDEGEREEEVREGVSFLSFLLQALMPDCLLEVPIPHKSQWIRT